MSEKYNYHPKGKLLWDVWFLRENKRFDAFYLQNKTSVALENRINGVSIGHASSRNLRNWKELSTALEPGKNGEWDDVALWTGSAIKRGEKYYLFYTGRSSKKGEEWVQRVGVAISADKRNWKKYEGNPILEAHGKYYSEYKKKNRLRKVPAFRDPYVFYDSQFKKYYMVFSARENSRKKTYNGCIGIAESNDLLSWILKKPIFAPGRYDEIECPQMILHNDKYYLFFLVPWEICYEPKWAEKNGAFPGLHCYVANSLFGEYKPANVNGVVISNGRYIYGTRLLQKKGDIYTAIGWYNLDKESNFIGKLSDPYEIVIKDMSVNKRDIMAPKYLRPWNYLPPMSKFQYPKWAKRRKPN